MVNKLEQLLDKAHSVGIRLPYLRDPLKGTPSVSLTLMVISFVLYLLALLNKIAGVFGGVDTDGTFQLLVLTTSLYFGRSFGNSGKGKTTTEEKK